MSLLQRWCCWNVPLNSLKLFFCSADQIETSNCSYSRRSEVTHSLTVWYTWVSYYYSQSITFTIFECQSTSGRGFPSFVLALNAFHSLFHRQYLYILLDWGLLWKLGCHFSPLVSTQKWQGLNGDSLEQFPTRRSRIHNCCEQFTKVDWPSTKSGNNLQTKTNLPYPGQWFSRDGTHFWIVSYLQHTDVIWNRGLHLDNVEI